MNINVYFRDTSCGAFITTGSFGCAGNTKEVAMAELDRAMQLAEAAGNAAPLMTAIRLKCELNRLIVKHEEVGKPGEFDHLSDQDVRARREALAAIVKVSYSAFELTDIGRQSR